MCRCGLHGLHSVNSPGRRRSSDRLIDRNLIWPDELQDPTGGLTPFGKRRQPYIEGLTGSEGAWRARLIASQLS